MDVFVSCRPRYRYGTIPLNVIFMRGKMGVFWSCVGSLTIAICHLLQWRLCTTYICKQRIWNDIKFWWNGNNILKVFHTNDYSYPIIYPQHCVLCVAGHQLNKSVMNVWCCGRRRERRRRAWHGRRGRKGRNYVVMRMCLWSATKLIFCRRTKYTFPTIILLSIEAGFIYPHTYIGKQSRLAFGFCTHK